MLAQDFEFPSMTVTREEYEEEGHQLCFEKFDIWRQCKKTWELWTTRTKDTIRKNNIYCSKRMDFLNIAVNYLNIHFVNWKVYKDIYSMSQNQGKEREYFE